MNLPTSGHPDNNEMLILTLVAIGAIMAGLWFAKPYVVYYVSLFRYYEADILGRVLPFENWVRVRENLPNANIAGWGYTQVWVLSEAVNRYISFVIAPIFISFGAWLWLRSPQRKYRQRHTMKTLLAQQAKVSPALRPLVGLNLLDADPEQGPWASAQTPIQFALKHDLLLDSRQSKPTPIKVRVMNGYALKLDSDQPRAKAAVQTAKLDRKAAARAFAAQLGPGLSGDELLERLPLHYRAILAAFILRRYGGKKGIKQADELLIQFNNSFYETGPKKKPIALDDLNTQGVDEVVRSFYGAKTAQGREVRRLFARHGFAVPMMMDAMRLARQRGKLTTVDFIWLKPIDRNLYFALNNMGRRTGWPESAGAAAHLSAEEVMEGPIFEPYVEKAVDALEKSLRKDGWLPPIPKVAGNAGGSPRLRPKNNPRGVL
jgi:intracellular multiplication protein IcmP